MAVALVVEQQASAAEAEFEWSLIGRSSYRAGGSETPVERASRDEGSLVSNKSSAPTSLILTY